MEEIRHLSPEKKDSADPLPALISYVSTHELEGFDSVNRDTEMDTHTVRPSLDVSEYFIISRFVFFLTILYHMPFKFNGVGLDISVDYHTYIAASNGQDFRS